MLDSGGSITSDGLEYDGTLFACGSNDAVVSTGDKSRSFMFDLSTRIPGSYAPAQENWLSGSQPFKGGLNVHGLGRLRDEDGATTWMTGQIDGPDRKTYRLRMTPLEPTDVGPAEVFGEGVNDPYETAFVRAKFVPGCATCPGNPYGKWEVVGDVVRTDEENPSVSYRQVATLYRVGNTWIKMGQFQLPFHMVVTLTSPLPQP
jgi:hypothetical protein